MGVQLTIFFLIFFCCPWAFSSSGIEISNPKIKLGPNSFFHYFPCPIAAYENSSISDRAENPLKKETDRLVSGIKKSTSTFKKVEGATPCIARAEYHPKKSKLVLYLSAGLHCHGQNCPGEECKKLLTVSFDKTYSLKDKNWIRNGRYFCKKGKRKNLLKI